MSVSVSREGAVAVLTLSGRLDTNSSPKLEAQAKQLYEQGSVDIVIDMAECDYVSSAGLRVIVSMQKRSMVQGSLVFRHVGPEVAEIFRATGFDGILTVK